MRTSHVFRFGGAAFLLSLFILIWPGFSQAAQRGYRVGAELVAEGFVAPLALAAPDDGSGRLLVVDQSGVIWVITPDGEKLTVPFLDLRDQMVTLYTDYEERGLLGLALHPDFAVNGRLFVYYSIPLRRQAPSGWDHTNVLSEFQVSADQLNRVDLASERIILQFDHPQMNHNGGHIAFGPDGYLYIPVGDGGGAYDAGEGHTPNLGNGQDTTNWVGSILRIDVDTAEAYAVPADNPFVGDDGIADEIYAYGFRNPYHIAFDRGGSGWLLAGDVGQLLYEEVDLIMPGGNYGWNIKEAAHCFDPQRATIPLEQCPATGARGEPLLDPIIEYDHNLGTAVIGGYIYRGSALPALTGHYIFGDYSTPFGKPDGLLLWARSLRDDGLVWAWGEIQVSNMPNERIGAFVRGFGEDANGKLYILTSTQSAVTGDTGKLWRLVPT